jgi:Ca-activated chloride channel homolog
VLAHQDFDDDRKDAGDIGAGHTVTALYEIVPAGSASEAPEGRRLRYQETRRPTHKACDREILQVRLRYKQPDGERSALLERTLERSETMFANASADFRFASSVAAFGMLLRQSPHAGNASYEAVQRWAKAAIGDDASGQRQEFLALAAQAARLTPDGRPSSKR